jgi:hypothetical protein
MGLTKAWTEDGLPGTTARVRSIKKPLCGFVQCGFRGNGYGMSDSKDDKTISVTGKKTFSLKRPSVEQGMVRQEMGPWPDQGGGGGNAQAPHQSP